MGKALKNIDEKFNLEHQYQLYLKRVGLNEQAMHPIQRQELKRAFIASWGQALVMLREDLSELEEDDAIDTLENMNAQVLNFFLAEGNKLN